MSAGSLTRYFENRKLHIPVYEIGDRVRGIYEGIPFIGSVGNDSLVSTDEGPRVTVHLDLPMMIDGNIRHVLRVEHKDIGPADKFSFAKRMK